MDAIRVPFILTSLRTRVDKSLGGSVSFPELPPNEIVKMMEILNINLVGLFQPEDSTSKNVTEIKTVEKSGGAKTQSQRIRQLLYLCYSRGIDTLEGEDEEEYYLRYTNKIIDTLSRKLESVGE